MMISSGVGVSIAGGGGEMVREEERWFVVLSVGRSFFFFFFVINSLLCLKVQKTHAALAMEIKNL